jgi:hypothetical protein
MEQLQKKAFNVRDEKHPVREQVKKCLGSHNLTVTVEEDSQTLSAMNHVDGLLAFLCTLKDKSGRVLSQGRGSSVLNPTNRFIGRTVASALNSSLADAAIRATKVLGTFYSNMVAQDTNVALNEAYSTKERATAFELITEKQRQYLWSLIQVQVDDEVERDRWQEKITEMSKNEASEMIASFAK